MTAKAEAGSSPFPRRHPGWCGPLHGTRIVELDGRGPTPFAAMLLCDLGADIVRVVRPGGPDRRDTVLRGRPSIELDLKSPAAVERLLQLVERADVLLEGYRPGVMERLGLGPEECLERNEHLVYARMTGWGQHGALRDLAGHDINYIAMAGALSPIGPKDGPPVPPLNLVADYGGGAMLVAVGILAALLDRQATGQGQVVDAAMYDGAALLTTALQWASTSGEWRDERGSNLLDGGAPYYGVYATADDRYVAVGAMEDRFYTELVACLELDDSASDHRTDPSRWPELREQFETAFRRRTQAEWCAAFAGRDACFTPVLTPREAPQQPQARSRETFVTVDGVVQPAPAPRFSRTPAALAAPTVARTTIEAVERAWAPDRPPPP